MIFRAMFTFSNVHHIFCTGETRRMICHVALLWERYKQLPFKILDLLHCSKRCVQTLDGCSSFSNQLPLNGFFPLTSWPHLSALNSWASHARCPCGEGQVAGRLPWLVASSSQAKRWDKVRNIWDICRNLKNSSTKNDSTHTNPKTRSKSKEIVKKSLKPGFLSWSWWRPIKNLHRTPIFRSFFPRNYI